MPKKKFSIFVFLLIFFVFLSAINFISAQQNTQPVTCNAGECYISETNSCLEEGEVINSKYCLNGNLNDQKQNGSTCLNNYECVSPYSCIEQICQTKYSTLDKTALQQVRDWFNNLFCGGGGNK